MKDLLYLYVLDHTVYADIPNLLMINLLFSHFLGSVLERLYPSLHPHTARSSFFVQTCSHPPLSFKSHGWTTGKLKKSDSLEREMSSWPCFSAEHYP